LDWIATLWKPFVGEFAREMRSVHPHAIVFVEPPVNEKPPQWDTSAAEDPTQRRVCYAPHWYDGLTLMNKHFSTWWTIDYIGYKRGKYLNIALALSVGLNGIKKNFSRQLGTIKDEGLRHIGTLIILNESNLM
jgi:hypothetical protein